MSLGQVPGGGLRGYYRLENVNDTGPNGFTLTNNNSVTFGAGKFHNAAEYGTSGTNKGLRLEGSNILSSAQPANVFIGFWFKLNSTANSGDKFLCVIHGNPGATNAYNAYVKYSIASGVLTVTIGLTPSVATFEASVTLTADTNWHFLNYVIQDSTDTISIGVDRIYGANATNTNTRISPATTPTVSLSIGNNRSLTNQVFAMVDEFIVSESHMTGMTTGVGERMRYFTQAKGRFCI